MAKSIGHGADSALAAASRRSAVVRFQAAFEGALDDGMFESAIEAVRNGLKATRTVRYRTPDGKIGYTEVPDSSVRLAAGVTVLQYALGKPVNRTEMTVKDAGEMSQRDRAMLAAQSLLEDPDQLLSVLKDWQDAAEHVKARKTAHAIDLESEGTPQ